MLADMQMDTGKHACRCLRHDNGGVRHLPVFKTKFLQILLAMHLIESYYILLPCHACWLESERARYACWQAAGFPQSNGNCRDSKARGKVFRCFISLRVHCTSLHICLLWLVAKFELSVCFKFSCATTSGLVLARWQPCRTSMRWRH